jgi:hypothetical protein
MPLMIGDVAPFRQRLLLPTLRYRWPFRLFPSPPKGTCLFERIIWSDAPFDYGTVVTLQGMRRAELARLPSVVYHASLDEEVTLLSLLTPLILLILPTLPTLLTLPSLLPYFPTCACERVCI